MGRSNAIFDFKDAVSYRTPASVSAVRCYPSVFGVVFFPVCPRCTVTIEREYQAFCDRCGQALDWKRFSKASVLFHT